MLAIAGQDPIVAFAQTRTRPLHHFVSIEAVSVTSEPDAVAVGKSLERNLLHRSAPPTVPKTGVVDDAAVTDVDAVVRVERAWRNEMGGKRRLVAGL
jgi:hypothetical protein